LNNTAPKCPELSGDGPKNALSPVIDLQFLDIVEAARHWIDTSYIEKVTALFPKVAIRKGRADIVAG
jgi:hypothetical protein